tara:strand:- start:1008 stop:1259 length:252 start_codon:yes stop_codon:yes gene_type:complete
MPLSTIGGRDYYTNAVSQSIDENYVNVPANTKAIYFPTADDYDIKFENGVEIELSPTAGQMTNIIPLQIKVHDATERTIHYLF